MRALITFLIFFFSFSLFIYSQTSSLSDNLKKNSPESSADKTISPVIDGRIKDIEWKDAKIFTDFTITSPPSKEKNYDSTIVYVKQNSDAIYFAFKYWPKGKVITQSLTRDRSTEEENEFFIVLDLENKNQNGYAFIFNFIGNQRDATIYNQRNQSYEWDWVWESNSKIIAEPKDGKPGYIETEIKIPVDKLQNKNSKQIGFDIQMFAYRPDGSYYWYSIIPESQTLSLAHTYKYDIKKPFNEKLNLNLNANPFAVGNRFNDSTYKAQLGGEFNISLDKHKLKGTYNTDESTLEADPFSFAFYGRSIFLQEKRPFFSKDLDIYRSPINLFYTRSIQNINYGFNYTYRSDKIKAGAIYVEEESRNGDRRRFFVARPKYNSDLFNLGSTFIYSTDPLHDYKEKVLSLDGKVNLPYDFKFIPQYITNFNGNAYMLNLMYENPRGTGPYGEGGYRRFSKNFESQTLFNDYGNDYDETWVNTGYHFARDTKYFNDINIGANYYRARRLSDNFNYSRGISMNINYRITGAFSIGHFAELNFPDGMDNAGNISKYRNWSQDNFMKLILGDNVISGGFTYGRYFGDKLINPYLNVSLALFNRFNLNLGYTYREFGEVKQNVYSAKMDFKVMDKLYLRSYFQKDTYRKMALWNTMLQYEFFAGSNAYLVFNLEGEKLQYTRRYFKLGYEFNL